MHTLRPHLYALLLGGLLLAGVAAACSSGITPGIKFGTGRNGAFVTGKGTNFPVDTPTVYFEVDAAHKFNSTQMDIQVVQQKQGGGDVVVDSATVPVASDDNVYSLPLTPSDYGAGQYRIVASIGGKNVASGTVTFR